MVNTKSITEQITQLRTSLASNNIIVEREKEIQTIKNFFRSRSFKILFIYGQSGLGKTILLNRFAPKSYLYLNTTNSAHLNVLKQKELSLAIVDEFDLLDEKLKVKILDSKFRKLVLISNFLDKQFIELVNEKHIKNQLISFNPYSKEEIVNILQAKTDREVAHFVDPRAIEYIANVCANCKGDLRQALEYVNKALDNIDISKDTKLEMMHVAKAISNTSNVDKKVTQKLGTNHVFCLLAILILTKQKKSLISVGCIYETYKEILQQTDLLQKLQLSEFRDILSNLEIYNLISIAQKKNLKIISLNIDQNALSRKINENLVISQAIDVDALLDHCSHKPKIN